MTPSAPPELVWVFQLLIPAWVVLTSTGCVGLAVHRRREKLADERQERLMTKMGFRD